LADHAHHLKTRQGRGGGFHRLEAARRTDHAFECTVIRLCCPDWLVGRTEPSASLSLSDADGFRASKLKHAVQGMNSDGDLCRATPGRPRAQCISDDSFEPADR
jgi:hypothetical protein